MPFDGLEGLARGAHPGHYTLAMQPCLLELHSLLFSLQQRAPEAMVHPHPPFYIDVRAASAQIPLVTLQLGNLGGLHLQRTLLRREPLVRGGQLFSGEIELRAALSQ
jgi:hypothetical protein